MRVAVDARMIDKSGIGTYIKQLMKNGCYDVAIGDKKKICEVEPKMEVVDFSEKGIVSDQKEYPREELYKRNIDVLHVPHYNIPLFYNGLMVTTLHDLTPLIFPDFLPDRKTYLYIKYMMKRAVRKSKLVFTVSENSKKDIVEILHAKPENVIVHKLAVGDEFHIMRIEDVDYLYDKYMIDRNKKVLLYVGNIKPHKNIERLLEAFSIVLKKDDGWQLVLVGKAFDDYDLLSNISSRFTNKEVLVTGAVSQEHLVGLYNLADLFILPSLYEGFGLIVLEALACGTQVACSNTSSLPEVGGKVVDYFDPYDVDDIADKILNHHIHDQKEIRKHLAEFSWKRTATVFKENVTRILRGNS